MTYREIRVEGRRVRRHVLTAEIALGRRLKPPEEVHHVDGDILNDVNSNLVICPDRAYHMLLHQRTRAQLACGNADWLKCVFCKVYDDPKNLLPLRRHEAPRHSKCKTAYKRLGRANGKRW